MTRDVVLLGATGSIGRQAMDLVRRLPGAFRVVGLGAAGSNPADLAALIVESEAEIAAVASATAAEALRGALAATGHVTKILSGPTAMAELAAWPCDVVLNGMTGSVGLGPTLAALGAGRRVALANKESLIAGGSLVTPYRDRITPVDSEHAALAQCLAGVPTPDIGRVRLTASGGPFREWPRERLSQVTPAEALAHPTWDMGPVISVNSATLVNKGLEVIEAHLLFGLSYDVIDVVVHPQSMVHAMVELVDGSTLLQAAVPDMRLPIARALGHPEVLDADLPRLDWGLAAEWTFEPLDSTRFPAVQLARAAGAIAGGSAVFNAANEEAVAAFLSGRLTFPRIVEVIEHVLDNHTAHEPADVEAVLALEAWARRIASEQIRAVGA